MKKILIISFSELSSDPRVRRQILHLKKNYKIITLCKNETAIKGVESYSLKYLKNRNIFDKLFNNIIQYKLLPFNKIYWRTFGFSEYRNAFTEHDIDLIIANDIESLPFAVEIKGNAKLIYDAHEYSPKQYEDDLRWKLTKQPFVKKILRKYLSRIDELITVCDGIAKEYEKVYGKKAYVLTNATNYYELDPTKTNDRRIKIIHHGSASKSRNIEKMMEMTKYLDERFALDLMLVPGSIKYLKYLKVESKKYNKVKIIQPVPMDQIPVFINKKYDIGLYLLPPVNFNLKYALPNKFYEFIQGRLAITIGPSIEMKKIVSKYNIGVVGNTYSPEDMATLINSLDAKKIDEMKLSCHKHAKLLSSDANMNKLDNIIKSLI